MMDQINLSSTAQKILAIYFANPERKFYVNELIRKTGLYPNAVHRALKSLEKQGILLSSRRGRLKLHALNPSYKFLPEIEEILRKQKKLPKKLVTKRVVDWFKLLNRSSSLAFINAIPKGYQKHMGLLIGYKFDYFWWNGITGGCYYSQPEMLESGRVIETLLRANPQFAESTARMCQTRCDALVRKAKKIPFENLPSFTKKELYKLLLDFEQTLLKLIPFMVVPYSVERYFSTEMEQRLQEYLGKAKKSRYFGDYLELLTSPISEESPERDDALRIAAHIQKYGFNKKAENLISQHTSDYCWLGFWSITKKPLDRGYFEDEIKNLAKKVKDPLKEIKRSKEREARERKKIKRAFEELGADKSFRDIVRILRSYIFLHTYRANVVCQAQYLHLPLLYEIAQRMQLSEEEIKYLTYDEMLAWLKHGYGRKFGYSYEGLKKEIAKRMSGWAVLMWKGKIKIITGVKNIIETMERYRIVAPGPQAVKVIKGNPACRGKVTGRVKIVRKLSELNKVEKGDILVAKMTTPDYVAAIHKAAAIVTDEGGVTCHAAIVSREFNLPCIIGTKNATQILSDNDLVEVDADEGVVRVVEAVELPEDIKQIYGRTAFKGKVCGPAKIVLDARDFPKIKEGDILVAPQTTPEYLSSLYKVKGFIVDEGSLTSHAMLYAKALRIPALIGTEFARNALSDGELIELDATGGVVRKL